MSGGKGGNTVTKTDTSGTSNVQIPQWLDTTAQSAVQRADTLSQQPWNPYDQQIVAGAPDDTAQAYQQVRDLQGGANPALQASQGVYSGLLGQAQPQTAAGINALSNQLYGNYAQNVINPAQGLLSGYLNNATPATAAQVSNNALQIMSPFSQAVIQPALQAGQQQLALGLQGVAQQANNVGAFGGTRQGVTEGVAQAQAALGAGQTVGNLLNQGWQSALTPAYNLANQQSQQGYSAAGLLAGLGQGGYNAAAQQAQGIGNTNLGLGMTSAQQLPLQALAQQAQAQREASMMQSIGTDQQQQDQAQLNAQMGQFYEGQNQPIQNLDVLLSAIGGVPYGTNTTTTGTGNTTSTKNPGMLDYISAIVGTAAKVAAI